MKLFAKLLLAVLVLAMLLPFTILKDDDGKTLLSFSDLGLPDFSIAPPKLPQVGEIIPGAESTAGSVDIYQWHDKEGNIQFSNEPPPQGTEFEIRRFDPAANVIQSIELPTAETDEGTEKAVIASQESGDQPVEIGNPYSKDSIEELFDKAKNVEKLPQQRFQRQDSTINH